MTKLEQKLIQLGYVSDRFPTIYSKKKLLKYEINFSIGYGIECYMETFMLVRTQQDLDELQQAFNEMQKDLEILKECEE